MSDTWAPVSKSMLPAVTNVEPPAIPRPTPATVGFGTTVMSEPSFP